MSWCPFKICIQNFVPFKKENHQIIGKENGCRRVCETTYSSFNFCSAFDTEAPWLKNFRFLFSNFNASLRFNLHYQPSLTFFYSFFLLFSFDYVLSAFMCFSQNKKVGRYRNKEIRILLVSYTSVSYPLENIEYIFPSNISK